MKVILILLFTMGMLSAFAQDETKPNGETKPGQPEIKLETDEQKAAYMSMFWHIEHLKYRHKPVVKATLFQAAIDALSGKPSKVANENIEVLSERLDLKYLQQGKTWKTWSPRKVTPADPKKWTDEEKYAYHSLYSRIVQWKKQYESFNDQRDILLQSAKDAFVEKVNRLEDENIAYLRRRMGVKEAVANNFEGKFSAKRNWEAGVAYQKANKEKEGVKVTASGLQYRVIKEGTGEKPAVNDTVSITYKVTYVGGMIARRVIESSTKPKKFKVAELLQGWAEGLQLMKVGAKYELVVPPAIAYGMPGCSTVIIEVELVDIVEENQ